MVRNIIITPHINMSLSSSPPSFLSSSNSNTIIEEIAIDNRIAQK